LMIDAVSGTQAMQTMQFTSHLPDREL